MLRAWELRACRVRAHSTFSMKAAPVSPGDHPPMSCHRESVDACVPLRAGSVDAFVTPRPFGHVTVVYRVSCMLHARVQ